MAQGCVDKKITLTKKNAFKFYINYIIKMNFKFCKCYFCKRQVK